MKASRATPKLERVRYRARIVSILEPGSDLVITSSIVKRITGSNKMHSRELFGKGKDMKTFTQMFTPIISCNKAPKVSEMDEATRRRVVNIKFESKFKHGIARNPAAKQFPIRDLDDKLPEMAGTLAYHVVETWKEFGYNDFELPSKVAEYIKAHDSISMFLEAEKVDFDDADSSYSSYKNWCMNDNLRHETKMKFSEKFSQQ